MQVHKRREVLGLEEGDVEDKMSDEFLSYKVASVVFNQAVKAVPGTYKKPLQYPTVDLNQLQAVAIDLNQLQAVDLNQLGQASARQTQL